MQLGEDAIGAVGVIQGFSRPGIKLQPPGLRLHRDDLGTDQMAWVPEKAPADGADPPGTTGQEPPDRGAAPGAGEKPQLPSPGPQVLVQITHQTSRLNRHHPGLPIEMLHLSHGTANQHHTAFHRHGLAVVARSRSPQGEGNAKPCTAGGYPFHRCAVPRPHHQISLAALQQRRQHR